MAAGYAIGTAIHNSDQSKQAPAANSDQGGGNTAGPSGYDPNDPNNSSGNGGQGGGSINLGLKSKDWTRWYNRGLVNESLRDNPNLGRLSEFRSYFREAAGNASRINFSLDGMDLTNVKNALTYNVGVNDVSTSVTDFELYSILRDKSLFMKTDFYMGGEKLSEAQWTKFISEISDAGWRLP